MVIWLLAPRHSRVDDLDPPAVYDLQRFRASARRNQHSPTGMHSKSERCLLHEENLRHAASVSPLQPISARTPILRPRTKTLAKHSQARIHSRPCKDTRSNCAACESARRCAGKTDTRQPKAGSREPKAESLEREIEFCQCPPPSNAATCARPTTAKSRPFAG